MIAELLELRNTLSDIAAELYGDLYVTNEAFWGSPTERQMCEIEEKLTDLGYIQEITPEQIEAARKVIKDLGWDLGSFSEDEI
jgi:hypothetical protein